jgi:hypothetical protein
MTDASSASLPTRDILFPPLASVGSAQNAGFSGRLSEPQTLLGGPVRAVFRLSPAPFSDATEPSPVWYGCQTPDNQWVTGGPNGRSLKQLRSGDMSCGRTVRFDAATSEKPLDRRRDPNVASDQGAERARRAEDETTHEARRSPTRCPTPRGAAVVQLPD